ncbi:MAG TPA: S24 family peptidase [Candidatus Saccharimonadales bacterium]
MHDEEDPNQPTFHAGFPNAAADAVDVPLDLNKLVVRHPTSTFYMRAGSDSWQGLGVNQDDILVIDRSLKPKPNNLVIASDGEGFSLVVIPIRAKGQVEELEVWGVVTYVIHRKS